MTNLFEPGVAGELIRRVQSVEPGNSRLWGKMTAAQALAHCSASLEAALGDSLPPRMPAGRFLGRLIKWHALRNDEPIRRNSPTAPEYVVRDERDLEMERQRLCGLIDRLATAGPAGCTKHPHSFFGRLKPQEWAILVYKHLDHHLRQFSA